VRLLASEHSTGKVHAGRIDTLGVDEDGCPVILEYKRAVSENVMNQGLYYLDWLLDHKAEFTLLVMKRFGEATADDIDWTAPRLICIAADFTKHDEHAIRQINRNIDLVRYRKFGSDLLALELITRTSTAALPSDDGDTVKVKTSGDKPVAQSLAEMDDHLRDLYGELRAYIAGLGDDVTEKPLKLYVAFKRIKNFATVAVQKKGFYLYLHLDPSTVDLSPEHFRDVTKIGHWGTGDLEIWITDKASLASALPLVSRSYSES
jgi:predicted transport protein